MSSPSTALIAPDPDQPDEFVELTDDQPDMSIEEDEDGGLIVTIGEPEEEKPVDAGFYANLAAQLPPDVLQRIATELIERIDQDKEARKKGDEQYEEGLRRTGMGKDAPGGADFEGASRVVHPMMTEAAIDYEARIMKELWPIGAGPVRPNILGEVTEEKTERADRKTKYMNYQLTTIIKEARTTMEQMLTQVPLGGAQYIRQWYDPRLRRPRWTFIPRDRVFVPEGAASYYSATRRTYSEILDEVQYRHRVESGMYVDIGSSAPSAEPDKTKTEVANQKIEGVDQTSINIDRQREIYETMVYLDISAEMAAALDCECEGDLYPYLVTIEQASRRILAIYRDWESDDPTREPIDHLYEFPFVPWRGAYAVGLTQIIGGLSGGATGALRALLDSAYIANTQGGLILKGSGTGAQTKRAQIGQFVQIEAGGMETPDIRQKVMPFATKEPSPTLFQLLGFLVEAGKGAVRTTLDDDLTDASTNVPVGTQLSRVENGLVVFSSLHGRIHEAFDRLLSGLHRLNRLYLPETVSVDANGEEIMVERADFEGPCDVQPVSEPTIYSDQQRFAQVNAIQQRSDAKPGLYDAIKVEKRFLAFLKIPNAEELLVQQPDPTEANAVSENMALAMGKPAYVFDNQDHLAHLQVHLDFMKSPLLGMNPIILPRYAKNALEHCSEHILHWYVQMNEQIIARSAGVPPDELADTDDPALKESFDKLLALASQMVVPGAESVFANAVPVMMAAGTALAKLHAPPPPPLDPAKAALQAATQETQRKTHADQMTGALKARQLEVQQAANEQKAQQADDANLTKITQTGMETASAKQIAAARLSGGQRPGLSDGASLSGGG